MIERKLKQSLAMCAFISTAMAGSAVAQPVIGSLLNGGNMPLLGGGNGGTPGSLLALNANNSAGGSDTAPADSGDSGGGQPLPGLGGEEGGEEGSSADDGAAAQSESSASEGGFGRHDGVIMFRDEQAGDSDWMTPSIYVHYTLSESLQSVRTCTAANDACVVQASVVLRDGEIERIRLFDEYLVGEPVPEAPAEEHRPPH